MWKVILKSFWRRVIFFLTLGVVFVVLSLLKYYFITGIFAFILEIPRRLFFGPLFGFLFLVNKFYPNFLNCPSGESGMGCAIVFGLFSIFIGWIAISFIYAVLLGFIYKKIKPESSTFGKKDI